MNAKRERKPIATNELEAFEHLLVSHSGIGEMPEKTSKLVGAFINTLRGLSNKEQNDYCSVLFMLLCESYLLVGHSQPCVPHYLQAIADAESYFSEAMTRLHYYAEARASEEEETK